MHRSSHRRILTWLFFCLVFHFGFFLSQTDVLAGNEELDCRIPVPSQPVEPINLRVALYPFTPDRLALFQKLESAFECQNPGVNVVLISTSNAVDDYYDYENDDKAHKGFQFVDADVYEIDTILLSDFVAIGKVAPIDLPYHDFSPEAIQAVSRDGKTYGVPHWLCGNFLFYRKSDSQIGDARSWKDISTVLASRNEGLLVDFIGSSTLGEWYLTALSSVVGLDNAQRQIVDGTPINADAVSYLQTILAKCPAGYCRSKALHNNTGSYARAFVRGQGAVYIGYSETIYYGLRETMESCLPGSVCLRETDIAVRSLPPFDPTRKEAGVGWVDAYAIDAGLAGKKKALALKFIQFASSDEMYQSMLSPEAPYSSRYLLPARQGQNIPNAPLYPQFVTAHTGRGTGTLAQLNNKLRDVATRVTCFLSVDRNDFATMKACAPHASHTEP
jgi:thiamine pyridinylase